MNRLRVKSETGKRFKNEKGAALTEYILIIALVAIASIAVLTIFGDQVRAVFSSSARQLSGDDVEGSTDVSGGAEGEVRKTLENF